MNAFAWNSLLRYEGGLIPRERYTCFTHRSDRLDKRGISPK